MATKKAAPKAVVINPVVTATITTASSNIYVSTASPNHSSIDVEFVDGEIDDVNTYGEVMDICADGITTVLGLTDQKFYNTVALLLKLREEYKKTTK